MQGLLGGSGGLSHNGKVNGHYYISGLVSRVQGQGDLAIINGQVDGTYYIQGLGFRVEGLGSAGLRGL